MKRTVRWKTGENTPMIRSRHEIVILQIFVFRFWNEKLMKL